MERFRCPARATQGLGVALGLWVLSRQPLFVGALKSRSRAPHHTPAPEQDSPQGTASPWAPLGEVTLTNCLAWGPWRMLSGIGLTEDTGCFPLRPSEDWLLSHSISSTHSLSTYSLRKAVHMAEVSGHPAHDPRHRDRLGHRQDRGEAWQQLALQSQDAGLGEVGAEK